MSRRQAAPPTAEQALTLQPIGVARTPHLDKASAPRQPRAAAGVQGRIELHRGRGFEDALDDLERFSHLWVVFWFHLNDGWRPKVLPPRSDRKRGLFATRSPHRPNPLGLSAVRLLGVEGLVLHVEDVDLVDGTPVLDLKPYVPYADALPHASSGWLEPATEATALALPDDPRPSYEVELRPLVTAQLDWLAQRGVTLRARLQEALSLGPRPHAYRRIKPRGSGYELALRDWRADFWVQAERVVVERLRSGYRPRELAEAPELELHRQFMGAFG